MRIPEPEILDDATANTLSVLPPLLLFRALAHAPTVLDPWLGLGGALLTTLDLDPVLRELAIIEVAVATGCDYERRQHELIGRGVGISDEQIDALARRDLDDRAFEPHGPVLSIVRDVATEHGCTDESMTLLRTMLTDREVVELLLVVGYYLGLAVLINALDLADEAPDGLAVLGLPQSGDPA